MKTLRIILLLAVAWFLYGCSSTYDNGVMINKSSWFGLENAPAQDANA
ncbi:MAG: hypothetical protein IKO42_00325 [Opitutales bacterium]|nr:hypothetical protein [Opitutales bacterium]